MSVFQPEPNSKLSESILSKVSVEAWRAVYGWSSYTELVISDPTERQFVFDFFEGRPANITYDDTATIAKWQRYKVAAKQQIPSTMPIDCAYAQGHRVEYLPDPVKEKSHPGQKDAIRAVIKSTQDIEVPLSRVPLASKDLPLRADGVRAPRRGSDVLAASIASMTRWTGKKCVLTMPIHSLRKRQFKWVDVEGIEPFLNSIPLGPKDSGMKGRTWAYHLMAKLQSMEEGQYMSFMTNWCRTMFRLPPPSLGVGLDAVFAENISLVQKNGKYYWGVAYGKPALLGTIGNAYKVADSYEEMGGHIMTFATERQGDNAGISMLSQSRTSWGLVSKSQAEIEQAVALIIGMGLESAVLYGFGQAEFLRVRNSVSLHSKIQVYQKVEPHCLLDTKTQVSVVPDGALYLIRGNTVFNTGVSGTREEHTKIKHYAQGLLLEKMWKHVELACADKKAVYLAAGLPPLETKINTFPAGGAWGGVFFFSQRSQLRRAIISAQGVSYTESRSVPPRTVWSEIVKGMNNCVASWIVPPINSMFSYSGLLAPLTVRKNEVISFHPDSDEVDIEYVDFGDSPEPDQAVIPHPRDNPEAPAPVGVPVSGEESVYVPTLESNWDD